MGRRKKRVGDLLAVGDRGREVKCRQIKHLGHSDHTTIHFPDWALLINVVRVLTTSEMWKYHMIILSPLAAVLDCEIDRL